MKKSRFITILLSVIFSTFLVSAEEPTTYAGIAKKKAMHEFNESLARLKRCFRGNCTKGDALRAVRDLGIAATLVIVGLYGVGGALKKGADAAYMNTPHQYDKIVYQRFTRPVERIGKYMQKPGTIAAQYLVHKPLAKAKRSISSFQSRAQSKAQQQSERKHPFEPYDSVKYRGQYRTVVSYDPIKNTVTLHSQSPIGEIVPASAVQLEDL